jgi:hypothetical protein
VHLVRHGLPQTSHPNDWGNPSKLVLPLARGYCFASVGEVQSLLSWRLCLYLPSSQALYSTFLDE